LQINNKTTVQKMKRMWLSIVSLITGNDVNEYCTGEAFEPRCHDSDVIIMLSARYGRMKIGRCVKREPGFESMLQHPRYLGCSADVLDIVSRICSGRTECSLRIPNQNFDNVKPNCYDNLKMHLEAAYMCINGKRRAQKKQLYYTTVYCRNLKLIALKSNTMKSNEY